MSRHGNSRHAQQAWEEQLAYEEEEANRAYWAEQDSLAYQQQVAQEELQAQNDWERSMAAHHAGSGYEDAWAYEYQHEYDTQQDYEAYAIYEARKNDPRWLQRQEWLRENVGADEIYDTFFPVVYAIGEGREDVTVDDLGPPGPFNITSLLSQEFHAVRDDQPRLIAYCEMVNQIRVMQDKWADGIKYDDVMYSTLADQIIWPEADSGIGEMPPPSRKNMRLVCTQDSRVAG
jgi:hypothetical protein